MTKKDLDQIKYLKAVIADLQDQLKNVPVVMDSVVGSRSEPPYDLHTIVIGGYDRQKDDQLRDKIGRKLNVLQDALYDFETLLDSVPDLRMGEVARLIYRDGLTQEQTACELGVSRKTVERSLKDFRRNYIDGE